jgi:hypothetical protein
MVAALYRERKQERRTQRLTRMTYRSCSYRLRFRDAGSGHVVKRAERRNRYPKRHACLICLVSLSSLSQKHDHSLWWWRSLPASWMQALARSGYWLPTSHPDAA